MKGAFYLNGPMSVLLTFATNLICPYLLGISCREPCLFAIEEAQAGPAKMAEVLIDIYLGILNGALDGLLKPH